MRTLKDLFEHQLKDLYSAETQLVDALPRLIENANNRKLKQAFEQHWEQIKTQKSRIETICREMNITPAGATCNIIKGLVAEAMAFMDEANTNDIMNAGLISEVQRILHNEISGYGTAVRFAKELGHREIAKTLQETLDEKYDAANALDKLADNRLNKKAIADMPNQSGQIASS